jgi:protein FAM32A
MQLADKVKKLAGKTHKDRVNELNTKLESLSEHHDIPKVSVIATCWCLV